MKRVLIHHRALLARLVRPVRLARLVRVSRPGEALVGLLLRNAIRLSVVSEWLLLAGRRRAEDFPYCEKPLVGVG